MTYGYDCSLVHPNDMRMWDYVMKLEVALNNARRYCQVCLVYYQYCSLGVFLVRWGDFFITFDQVLSALSHCVGQNGGSVVCSEIKKEPFTNSDN